MVTVNYSNKRPLWEFMENTDAPIAPTKEMAVDSVAAVIDNQMGDSPVVDILSQEKDTVIVQPSIVQTEAGTTVVNPTIVVAPAIVQNSEGEKIVVTPDITLVEPKQEQQEQQQPTVEQPQQPQLQQSGCYPIRKYDMSKVQPIMFDDYQQFSA
jgi:hypothetical protein